MCVRAHAHLLKILPRVLCVQPLFSALGGLSYAVVAFPRYTGIPLSYGSLDGFRNDGLQKERKSFVFKH